ncbi:MAG TPA: protein kinase [Polyangia bacterium]|nr:protein kinase [Polyangia bacterium]
MEAESPTPPDPRIGNVLQGRYAILSRIASGAMGVVYKGERLQLGRPVAVKFLHPWIAAQKAFLGRFENEAKAMSRLAHPHCVSVIDFGVEGSPYLVMDFATGRTLREVMQQAPLPIARVMRIAQQLLSGLAHAHAQGIVHRDLKPENLILSGDSELEEHLRILDFGLAKLRDGPAMTAGLAVGTPSYMSPEQSGGSGAVDSRTDLYTVGVLLFEILAGRKPFQSENVGEVILMHREVRPPRLREVAPTAGYSAALDAVLDKALAKLPEDRFQTAAELAAALAATPEGQGGKPIAAPPAPTPAKTTIDTVSAVRRRLGKLPGDRPPVAASSAATSPARPLRVGGVIAGFALLVVVLLALTLGRGLRRRTGENAEATSATAAAASPVVPSPAASVRAQAAAPVAAPPIPSVVAPSSPEDPRIEQARQLVAAGQTAQAIQVLERMRAEKPSDADAPYLLATIYFDGHRWTEGLSSAQVAMKKNPAFRTDGDLIRGAIRALVSDTAYPRAQALLRGLGAAALPFLEDSARRDPSSKVRQRAGELVGGGHVWSGGRRSSTGMFKR